MSLVLPPFSPRATALAVVFSALVIGALGLAGSACAEFPTPEIDWDPATYVASRCGEPPVIDGKLDDPAWEHTPWTEEFVDIEGERKPLPRHATRVKMLWDDESFYVGAWMDEPHVWATYDERDAVIYHENDFEVFIDPDGDNHEYYELEINALGTVWDLLLLKPYRDGGPAVNAWDIQGLRSAVHVDGTLNDPDDVDRGWSVELAFPWSVLKECAHRPTPPEPGDTWRVNFSRVQWRTEPLDGHYVKLGDPETGKPLPEDNWVWSPQGLIAMHYPEMWGFVTFADPSVRLESAGTSHPEAWIASQLMRVYYAQKRWFESHGAFTDDPRALGLGGFLTNRHGVESAGDSSALQSEDPPVSHPPTVERRGATLLFWPPRIHVTPARFEATLTTTDGRTFHVSEDGHLW